MLTTWYVQLPTGDKANREAVKHVAEVPLGADMVGIAIKDDGLPYAYFDCDTEKPLVPHTFFISGTGYNNEIMRGEVIKRVGMFQYPDEVADELWIWHVWHKPYGH